MGPTQTFEKFIILWEDLMNRTPQNELVKFHILDFMETFSMVHGFHERFTRELFPNFIAFTNIFHFINEKEIVKTALEFLQKSDGKFYIDPCSKTA